MTFLIILVLVVFNSSSRANSYHEYSTFVTDEDFEHQFFSDELEDTNYTSEFEELNKLRQEADAGSYTTVDSARLSFPYPDDEQGGEKEKRNEENQQEDSKNFESSFDHPGGHVVSNSNRDDEITSEKHLLDHFSKIHNKVYSNYEESFHSKDREPNQPPMRREINSWRDEISNANNAPWSMDAFYPRHGSPSNQNDYFDDASYAVDSLEQKNDSASGGHLSLKELLIRDEQTPYYQKNYYYNYYPLTNTRKFSKSPKWGGPDEHESEETGQSRENSSGRKLMRKSACKQYLQFLKYAFEKLDENNDYNYDYNEDYNEEWRDRAAQRNHKVFAVHLLGPTLYVDNSGKVSQINTKGNSYQNIDGISSLPKTMAPKKDDTKFKTTTPPPFTQSARARAERLTTLPNDNVYYQPRTTTELPWLNISLKTNLTGPNMTKEQKLNPDIQHRSTFGTRVEEEWRQQVGDEVYETTVRTKTEHTVFDEYDYGDTKPSYSPVNTYPPKWYPSEEYYRKLAKALGKKENDTKSNVISSETNAAVGPPLYWYSQTSTPQATTLTPVIFDKSLRYEPTEISTDFTEKKEDDCNDKMLPCPDTVNVTYPLNGYCNRYVSCESGRAIRKICPEGLHFNIITKSCDLPHNSFCTYTCPAANGYYGIPGDCGGYFVCKNFIPEYRMCPPRMHWDLKRSTCTFSELSSCPMKCAKASDVKHYEGDCKAYVICLNGIPYYHKCPPNTKFDRKAQTCVPGHQSKCEDDPRLLTKTSNPNHLCRDVEVKLGTKVWCNHFYSEDNQRPRKPFEK